MNEEGRTRNILSRRYVIVINVTDKLQKGKMVKFSTVFAELRKCCGRGQVEGRKGKASAALCASAYARMLPPTLRSFGGTSRRDKSAYAGMLPPPPSFGATSRRDKPARQAGATSRRDKSARQVGATSRRDKSAYRRGERVWPLAGKEVLRSNRCLDCVMKAHDTIRVRVDRASGVGTGFFSVDFGGIPNITESR
jgi:hypothetical protein